jgi:hypothetical protein
MVHRRHRRNPHHHRLGAGVSYDADASSLFARFTTPADDTRKGHINTLIVALKAAGSWDKMDCLYVHAAADAQAARLNWKAATFELTENGALNFSADHGYLGGSSGLYLTTGFIESSAGGVMSQNDAHTGAWSLTDANENAPMLATSGATAGTQSSIYSRTGGNFAARLNDANGSSSFGAVADSLGHFVVARTGATRRGYKAGSVVSTVGSTTGGPSDTQIVLLGDSGAAQWSTKRQAISHWGSNLTDAEVAATETAMEAYLTSVGAFL